MGSFAEITSFGATIAALRTRRIRTEGLITHRFTSTTTTKPSTPSPPTPPHTKSSSLPDPKPTTRHLLIASGATQTPGKGW